MKKLVILLAFLLAFVLTFSVFAGGRKDDSRKTVAVLIPGPVGYFNAVREGVDRGAKDFGINVVYAD